MSSNPDVHKQIGCMNSIFHHFLGGRRHITHHRLPPGQNGNSAKDSKNATNNTTEMNQKKNVKEKHRTSTESSRTSVSSSSSSSLSSIECNRASQLQTADQPNPSPHLKDVVKDSIYRESRGLLVKTVSKGKNRGQTLKYFDSPRPMQQQQKTSVLKESVQILQSPRDRNHTSPRRFSLDERESRDNSKSATKLKELPRLSLDSRAGSMRGSNNERKSDHLLSDAKSTGSIDQQEEPESRTRLSNVVAKLMGLEVFPDADNSPSLGNLRTNQENKQSQVHNEPLPPHPRNDSIKKSVPISKFPIEPAPWRQPKSPNTPLSVYGEIEKRLAQLEFRKSGKDLRALKQILEAMQKTKEMLDSRNEAENLGTQNLTNNTISDITKSTASPKSLKSPIVIMKPGKLAQRATGNRVPSENATESLIGKRTSKESSLRSSNLRDHPSLPSRLMDKNSAARLTRGSHSSTRKSANSDNSSVTFNTRQPQKKLGLEKQTRSVPSDSIRGRRRQPTESDSPRRKPRTKTTNFQLTDDESSDLSHRTDSMSLQSETTSLASLYDEVSSRDRSNKINGNIHQSYRRQKPVGTLVKDRSIPELTIPSTEQPSPVSVLDATFYADDLPSPIKKKSIVFKDDNEWSQADANNMYRDADYSLNSLMNHKQAESIRFMTHNFIEMLSTEKESSLGSLNPEHEYISEILLASGFLRDFESEHAPIHISQTGHPISPDVFVALEQLKDTKTKSSQLKLQSTKRKLVFDVVNEILANKFLLESSRKQCCTRNRRQRGHKLLRELCSEVDRLQGKASNFDLDEEDDTLTSILEEDMRRQTTQWTACSSEIPGLVLDVERLIFKDLITEVVTCETLA